MIEESKIYVIGNHYMSEGSDIFKFDKEMFDSMDEEIMLDQMLHRLCYILYIFIMIKHLF